MSADFDRWANQLDHTQKLCACGHLEDRHRHYHDLDYCGSCPRQGPKACRSFHRQRTEYDRERQQERRNSRVVVLLVALFVLAFWTVAILTLVHFTR